MKSNFLRNLLFFLICAGALTGAAGGAFVLVRDMHTHTRGVSARDHRALRIGVNVALEQYSDVDLDRALALVRAGGFSLVRQHFYWSELEPQRGVFAWEKADRLIARTRQAQLDLLAVIDTTPTWARHPGEADLLNAPPANVEDYAQFVATFVARYNTIPYIQIWDNPNVHPFWGRRNANPFEYAKLLCASARRARAVQPQIKILSAGLAASQELIRERPDFSDVLYLRGMYDADARECFDMLGIKAYGMWSGAEDRRVAMDTFNFSRAILLREEMLAHGDVNKPVWAVEFGWNALPSDWRGKPSPWGSDTEATQAARLAEAIQRARTEWGWMTALVVQHFQPNAPNDDPVWGFALMDQQMQPRELFTAVTRAMTMPTQTAPFDFVRLYAITSVLSLVALIAAWQGWRTLNQLPLNAWWSPIQVRFGALPEIIQLAVLLLAVLAFYYVRNTTLSFVLLAAMVFLFALRLDLGLVIAVFTIPFYLFPKNLVANARFSLIELLTLALVAGWIVRQLGTRQSDAPTAPFRFRIPFYFSRLTSTDRAVIFFVLAGLLSVAVASNFGVANREWRVIVIEPALLYALIRATKLDTRGLDRLANAFLLSALAISLIGLYQYMFTNWVIIGEGVRRILAVYGSPNNLALYLDRALPLALALALFTRRRRQQMVYACVTIVLAVCLYLTYSRGAWLIGMPAGLLVIGLVSGRRVRTAIITLLIIAALALIPFAQTERAQSWFQSGTGTGFFRVSVWEAGWRMIRDHPILGVGLDNFLYEYPKYMNREAWREPNLSHPHNVVLDFWVRMGVLGLVALGWMVFEFYNKGIRALRGEGRVLAIGLLASMTAALAHGMIDASYFYVDLAFVWMLSLGLIAASRA